MKAYSHIRFVEHPDVADIQEEGRKSSVGRNDAKSYTPSKKKAAIRRRLKRRNRTIVARLTRRDE